MTDKCWFVLPRSHYSAPVLEEGVRKAKGPLCIGHVIPNLKVFDIVNPGGPEEYPLDMTLYEGAEYDIKWKVNNSSGVELSTDATVPIAAAVGLTVESNAEIAFKKWANKRWQSERLDTYHVNITQSYIDDTMDSDEVKRWIANHKVLRVAMPDVYIVTGIMVARTAKITTDVGAKSTVNAGYKVDVPDIVGVGGKMDISGNQTLSQSHKASDFVFAIRVAKVSRGLLDSEWSFSTFTKGATLSAGENSQERSKSIQANLAAVGLENSDTVGLADGEDIFVYAFDSEPVSKGQNAPESIA